MSLLDVICLNNDYDKLAELRNRLLCIPSSETTSERSFFIIIEKKTCPDRKKLRNGKSLYESSLNLKKLIQ